jgi:signal transduction histidine kinase
MSCFGYNGAQEHMMTGQTETSNSQLKEACKLTGTRWAVWLFYVNGQWEYGPRQGLNRSRQSALGHLLESSRTYTWLAGALNSGYVRWKKTENFDLDCQRIYIFPNPERHQLLMIGVDDLDKKSESIFKILTRSFLPHQTPPFLPSKELPIIFQDTQQPIWQVRAELEASYNPQTILDNILEFLSGIVLCDAAYLAIRSGDIFRIQATWNCLPPPQNLDLSIRKIQIIEKISTTRQGMILTTPDIEQETLLPQVTELPGRAWLGIPIVIGQRVIGLVAFVAALPSTNIVPAFDVDTLQQATQQVSTLAYNVENAIVFAEATRYLQQLALLNELAVTASLSIDINEVSRRVMQRLRRAFDTDWAAVFLISPGDNILREYGGEGRGETPLTLSVETSLVGYTISSGHPVRSNDLQNETRFVPQEPELRSEMAVPLRYRGTVIGAIDLVSKDINAFSNQDEQLLGLIAGQLAGLFENMRLNEELRAYIRQLEESQRALIQAEKMAIAGRLTASIAHEINNPLQAVSNCLHLAGRKELSLDDRQIYLDLAQEELDRLMQIVQRMLDFYRPGALDRQPTDIHALLHKVFLLMEKQFSDHAVQVHLNYAQNLPYVYVVSDQIQQVFLNLALNAVEAMQDGGDLIIETTHSHDQVRIIFQDTGSGVLASKRKTIFEPFVSSKQGGTGLGLAISYGIITAHGGSLELLDQTERAVPSTSGAFYPPGARFLVTLKTGENE